MPWLFLHCSWRSASRLAFPLECSETFCALQTAPVCSPVPGYRHRAWAQPVLTAVSKTLTKCSGLSNALLGYVGLFHTDWEEDFPAQLTQCSSEVCHMAFSSPILFWKQLSIIMHCLTSACSWWGKANIRTTSWQSQADAVWLYYWMQLIRIFSFSLWRYSPATPQHSRLKRNLEFISKTTSNFLAAKESICKWE